MAADKLELEPPSLPHKRKRPKRFDSGTAQAEFFDSSKAYFKVSYFEALDLVIMVHVSLIKERFGFKVYCNLQELVTKAAKGEKYDKKYDFVVSFYEDDLNPTRLHSQLELLRTHFSTHAGTLSLMDVVKFLKELSAAQKEFFSELIVLAKLILVMPATNTSSERAFSALRRLKTYLRNTMSQERLNHVMLLHVHKEMTDKLKLADVANDL